MHGVDVMRVREWYLQGQAKHYRQNILLSSFRFPELRALFNTQCKSHSGLAKLDIQCKVFIAKNTSQRHCVFAISRMPQQQWKEHLIYSKTVNSKGIFNVRHVNDM